jgi:hypothetical protein
VPAQVWDRCQIQGLFWGPWVLLPAAGYLFGDPKFSLWGPKFSATCNVRGLRHVPIERKHSNDARGLDMLLID